MKTRNVCILGGSGFVGRHVAHLLEERGVTTRILTRAREQSRDLLVLPNVELVEADVHDDNELARQLRGMDAVINLVGVLHDGRGRGSFAAAHVELPRKLVQACQRSQVRRLLHMSALKADLLAPSQYLRSKAEGEAHVLQPRESLAVSVFRPSVIFGPEDGFLNRFAALIRGFPVLPLGSADARFQPVYVDDVARVLVDSLDDAATYGRSYNVCGPRVYTLRELVQLTADVMDKKRLIIALPPSLARVQAMILEWLPGKMLTRDNLRSMQVANVCDSDFEAQFGFAPAALAAIAPTYLANRTPRGRYDKFRHTAGR